jgi:hypothetical protein
MELIGDEKRIQALFSELSLEDQNSAPHFHKLWNRAETTRPVPVRRFNRAVIVIASAVVTVAACALIVWSWYTSTQQSPAQDAINIPRQTPATPAPQLPEPDKLASGSLRPRHERQKRIARPRQTERALTRDAAMLSSWQSPTEKWIQSPTSFVLNSLPQLNQSAQELQQFLPKNNEAMKESNQ